MADRRRTPRKWRKLNPHEYALRMGPVAIVVSRWSDGVATCRDEWMWGASTGRKWPVEFLRGHGTGKGATLAKCQADAIAAVERWRDSIR